MTRRLNNNLAALAAILILINRIGFEEAFSRSQKSPNISPISFLGRLRWISIQVKIYCQRAILHTANFKWVELIDIAHFLAIVPLEFEGDCSFRPSFAPIAQQAYLCFTINFYG